MLSCLIKVEDQSSDQEPSISVSVEPHNPLDDSCVHEICSKERYVSDGIKTDYLSWSPKNPILISAQTGSGKNTFIENILLPYVKNIHKKILILSNRVANNRQLKKRICSLTGCEEYLEMLTPKGLDKQETFANVTIMTYQKLQSIVCHNDIFTAKAQFKDYYVIFDECHFFTSDTLFNNMTDLALNNCIKIFNESIRIYMTATPDDIFPQIVKNEQQFYSSLYNFIEFANPATLFLNGFRINYYNFRRNYSYVKTTYFDTLKEIIEYINNDYSESKWLIFINSKEGGKKYVSF